MFFPLGLGMKARHRQSSFVGEVALPEAVSPEDMHGPAVAVTGECDGLIIDGEELALRHPTNGAPHKRD
jgi:hypothetical protein